MANENITVNTNETNKGSDKYVQYKAEDIQRIIFHLNNLSFKGIDQASAVVDMINILNGGKLVDNE